MGCKHIKDGLFSNLPVDVFGMIVVASGFAFFQSWGWVAFWGLMSIAHMIRHASAGRGDTEG